MSISQSIETPFSLSTERHAPIRRLTNIITLLCVSIQLHSAPLASRGSETHPSRPQTRSYASFSTLATASLAFSFPTLVLKSSWLSA